ncbi:hypothetical protein EGJ50_23750 [Pseudomonas luteola]|nr:hypothetical protein EGJ50_23750 [Pseudomonas luteola]
MACPHVAGIAALSPLLSVRNQIANQCP